MRTTALLTCLLPAVLLTGCGSLTGFSNAQTDFSCGDLTGKPSCRNISDVYAQTQKEAEDAQNLQVPAAFAAQAEELEFEAPKPFLEFGWRLLPTLKGTFMTSVICTSKC